MDKDEKKHQEVKEGSGCDRRDFIKKTGAVTALAHFVALGGVAGKAFADVCAPSSTADVCEPSPDNYDRDECQPANGIYGDPSYVPEAGDTCGPDEVQNPDTCAAAGQPVYGDT